MISLVIPSREPEESLIWATLASASADLAASDLEHEIILVLCGPPFPGIGQHIVRHGLAKVAFSNADSPQIARNLGAAAAKGETIFFLDAHVLVPPGFFRCVFDDMQATGAALMHTPHKFLRQMSYGYRVAWGAYLWSAGAVRHPSASGPFKIGVAGHGAYAIHREVFERVGRYWGGLRGFGGEEVELNFKLWAHGYPCWMTPRTYHWHFVAEPQRHGEEIYWDRNLVRNFLLVAAIYGGREQVEKSYQAFCAMHWNGEQLFPELPDEAMRDAAQEREKLLATSSLNNIAALRTHLAAAGAIN